MVQGGDWWHLQPLGGIKLGKGLLYARITDSYRACEALCYGSQGRELFCQFRPLPACFAQWKTVPLEEKDDDALKIPTKQSLAGWTTFLLLPLRQSKRSPLRAGRLLAGVKWGPTPHSAYAFAFGVALFVSDLSVLAQRHGER